MPGKVSIVIPNWNGKELLKKCLQSIKKSTLYKPFEVIVVENGSSDGSKEMLKKDFKWVKVVENKENKGVPFANNQGVKAAPKSDYYFFLNN